MAIMNKCCCCGVRGGSIASAVYSITLSFIGLIWFSYNSKWVIATKDALNTLFGSNEVDLSVLNVMLSVYIIGALVLVVLFIASIMLIIGVSKDIKQLLFPYMLAQAFHMLWYVYYFITLAYYIYLTGFGDLWGKVYLGTVVVLWLFAIADVVCLICVVSQYQEYRDGRGCATDDQQLQNKGAVVVQQQPMIQNPNVVYNPVPEKEAPPAY